MITDSTTFLWTAALKATVVFAGTLLFSIALRRASAAARYFLWMSALATALAIPLLSLAVRPWSVPVAAPVAAISFALEAVPAHSAAAGAQAATAVPLAARLVAWLVPLWLCGVLAVLARVAIGHARVSLSIRRSEAVPGGEWTTLLDETNAQLGVRRPVALRRSDDTEVPFTYGLLRPIILLPRDADRWTAERRRLVLLHELTHIRRLDALSCLVAQLSCAAYWFHPLAWLALARFRSEQERSCDDAVIIAGTGRSDYAGHLVSLARAVTGPRRSWPAALGMADTDFEQRVHALLDPRRRRRALNWRVSLAALAAIAACAIPFAALRAQESKPTSSLAGTVRDPSGAVVPNVKVVLKNTNGKNQEVTRANAAGDYQFAAIEAGTYDIEVLAPGFKMFQKSGLPLVAGNVMRQDVNLAVGSVTESIDVVGTGHRPVPAAATGRPQRIGVGGNVQASMLIKQAKPVYPPNAAAAGIEGTVLLKAIISKTGNLISLTQINTSVDPELAQAAIEAAQQWQYRPTLLNGQPVEVVTTISVNFRLQE